MTFVRAVFLFAIVMLTVGMVGSRLWLQNTFGTDLTPPATVAVAARTASDTPTPAATATPGSRSPRKTAMSGRVAYAHAKVAPVRRRLQHPRTPATPRPTATATLTPVPTPSPTPGTVELANYWVSRSEAAHGNTIALGYVIDNGTGRTLRLLLGASLKSARTLSWSGGALSDPTHDVVAIVPPGTSTHERFFTLPRGLRPGTYDVAWGLRDVVNGERAGLVAAPAALHVIG